MTDMTFEELEAKVGRGMDWLAEHDPAGIFHLWFTWGLTASTPLPAQDADRREEWRRYYRQRQIWEQLDEQYRRMEAAR